MKLTKIFTTGFVAVTILCITASAFAAGKLNMKDYYSSTHQQGHKLITAVNYPPPATDITVSNVSNYLIRAIVPDSPINDPIPTNGIDHIYNQYYSGPTEVVLTDVYGQVFFDHNVDAQASIYVTSAGGNLYVNVVG